MNQKVVLIRDSHAGPMPTASRLDRIQDNCTRCRAPSSITDVSFNWTGTRLVWGPCLLCEAAEVGETSPREKSAAA